MKVTKADSYINDCIAEEGRDNSNGSEIPVNCYMMKRVLKALEEENNTSTPKSISDIVFDVLLDYKQCRPTKEYGIMTIITFEQFREIADRVAEKLKC